MRKPYDQKVESELRRMRDAGDEEASKELVRRARKSTQPRAAEPVGNGLPQDSKEGEGLQASH